MIHWGFGCRSSLNSIPFFLYSRAMLSATSVGRRSSFLCTISVNMTATPCASVRRALSSEPIVDGITLAIIAPSRQCFVFSTDSIGTSPKGTSSPVREFLHKPGRARQTAGICHLGEAPGSVKHSDKSKPNRCWYRDCVRTPAAASEIERTAARLPDPARGEFRAVSRPSPARNSTSIGLRS